MLELLLLAIFVSVMLAVIAVGFAVGSRRKQALRRALDQARKRNPGAFAGVGSTFSSLGGWAVRHFAFLFPDSLQLRRKLTRAGYDRRTAPLTYSSIRVMLLAALPVLAFVAAFGASGRLEIAYLWAVVGVALALTAPPYMLRRQIKQRAQRIQKHLPDGLDLMVVCVEAGLGLDAAILKVADELTTSHPEIAREFRVVTQLVNAGVPRIDALKEMTDRTGVSEVRSLVSTLTQAERLGTPIARTLRIHADQLRTKRRQRAEEAAAKAPIKMLVPMVLFVLPALFVVVVGPAILVLKQAFSSMVP